MGTYSLGFCILSLVRPRNTAKFAFKNNKNAEFQDELIFQKLVIENDQQKMNKGYCIIITIWGEDKSLKYFNKSKKKQKNPVSILCLLSLSKNNFQSIYDGFHKSIKTIR